MFLHKGLDNLWRILLGFDGFLSFLLLISMFRQMSKDCCWSLTVDGVLHDVPGSYIFKGLDWLLMVLLGSEWSSWKSFALCLKVVLLKHVDCYILWLYKPLRRPLGSERFLNDRTGSYIFWQLTEGSDITVLTVFIHCDWTVLSGSVGFQTYLRYLTGSPCSCWISKVYLLISSLAVKCWWPPRLDYLHPCIPPELLKTFTYFINPPPLPLSNLYDKPFQVFRTLNHIHSWRAAVLTKEAVHGGLDWISSDAPQWISALSLNIVIFVCTRFLSLVLKPLKVHELLKTPVHLCVCVSRYDWLQPTDAYWTIWTCELSAVSLLQRVTYSFLTFMENVTRSWRNIPHYLVAFSIKLGNVVRKGLRSKHWTIRLSPVFLCSQSNPASAWKHLYMYELLCELCLLLLWPLVCLFTAPSLQPPH